MNAFKDGMCRWIRAAPSFDMTLTSSTSKSKLCTVGRTWLTSTYELLGLPDGTEVYYFFALS